MSMLDLAARRRSRGQERDDDQEYFHRRLQLNSVVQVQKRSQ